MCALRSTKKQGLREDGILLNKGENTMSKTILLTGATDGIGLAAAGMLLKEGHTVLLHGRSATKLEGAAQALAPDAAGGGIETYVADLSRMYDVLEMIKAVKKKHTRLDVLINNAGVYVAPMTVTPDALDFRFAVNTVAPYLLTKRLLPLMGASSRVVNVSSAAQAPLDPTELGAPSNAPDGAVYARSKLALTMWTGAVARSLGAAGPMLVSVNPKSMLGTKMVKEAYGVHGADVRIGAEILCRAALSDEFADASGKYFDNDSGRFASPHPDALDSVKCEHIVRVLDAILDKVAP